MILPLPSEASKNTPRYAWFIEILQHDHFWQSCNLLTGMPGKIRGVIQNEKWKGWCAKRAIFVDGGGSRE